MEASAPPSCAVRRWDSVWGLERPVDPSTREAEKRGGYSELCEMSEDVSQKLIPGHPLKAKYTNRGHCCMSVRVEHV